MLERHNFLKVFSLPCRSFGQKFYYFLRRSSKLLNLYLEDFFGLAIKNFQEIFDCMGEGMVPKSSGGLHFLETKYGIRISYASCYGICVKRMTSCGWKEYILIMDKKVFGAPKLRKTHG